VISFDTPMMCNCSGSAVLHWAILSSVRFVLWSDFDLTSSSLTAQINVYVGDLTWEQSHATTHIGQILLGVSHTHLDSAHTSALPTAQHMTHRHFTLVSATKFKHKHQTDLCATSIIDDETPKQCMQHSNKSNNNKL
jgi:hypothetical protein